MHGCAVKRRRVQRFFCASSIPLLSRRSGFPACQAASDAIIYSASPPAAVQDDLTLLTSTVKYKTSIYAKRRYSLFGPLTILLCMSVWIPTAALAQRAEWGEVSRDVMERTAFPADSNAAAVALLDYGRVRVRKNLQLVFERHRRVKLLSEAAYDAWGTVEIPCYADDDVQEVSDIEGQTFVLGPEGEVARHELDDDVIFDEDVDGASRRVRFTLPALAPGAVIEYRYEIESAHPLYMPDWSFQAGEPTRWSEFRVTIPEMLDYVTQFQGSKSPDINESDDTRMQLRFRWEEAGFSRSRKRLLRMQAVKRRWVMKDVPALREEPFMTTPDDYRAMLRFQLARIGLRGQRPLWEMRS